MANKTFEDLPVRSSLLNSYIKKDLIERNIFLQTSKLLNTLSSSQNINIDDNGSLVLYGAALKTIYGFFEISCEIASSTTNYDGFAIYNLDWIESDKNQTNSSLFENKYIQIYNSLISVDPSNYTHHFMIPPFIASSANGSGRFRLNITFTTPSTKKTKVDCKIWTFVNR